ncbi:hypothetical protein RJ640_005263 [Escallonia rubra]|uniref:Uncharacterized protein n=1 Tax=Escallonia rubra TaxID=112253 RepID=A0AA88U6Y7_9ASTE|nr:hypothetical protein RJ640_005263 [Escallonia rubra]
MMSDYNVEMLNDGLGEFNVELHGPEGICYRIKDMLNLTANFGYAAMRMDAMKHQLFDTC